MYYSIYLVDLENYRFYMEKINGETLKEFLWSFEKGIYTTIMHNIRKTLMY